MTPEQKAKEIFEKYLGIIGTNCEHNCYCDREECNKLGYTFCHVDYKTAKACAIEEVKAVLKICPAADGFNPFLREDDSISFVDYYMKVLTEIEKL